MNGATHTAIFRKLAQIERHKRAAAKLVDEVEVLAGIDGVTDDDTWYWGSHVDEQRTISVEEMGKLLATFMELRQARA